MELKFILESLLFSAQKPLTLKEIRDVLAGAVEHAEGDETVAAFKKTKEADLTAALEQLAKEHEEAKRS
ncbi:MAG: segregation and condensation protein B, partial [Verrucomicrobiota bacterium]